MQSHLQHFESMVSGHAAHLNRFLQEQLFSMTTYDANKEVNILAFAVETSEDGDTWSWFLRNCFKFFLNVKIFISDDAKRG